MVPEPSQLLLLVLRMSENVELNRGVAEKKQKAIIDKSIMRSWPSPSF